MEGDTIIEGFNLSALLRNFNKLKATVAVQAKFIEQQQVCIGKLEKQISKKENNSNTVVDDLLAGFSKNRNR